MKMLETHPHSTPCARQSAAPAPKSTAAASASCTSSGSRHSISAVSSTPNPNRRASRWRVRPCWASSPPRCAAHAPPARAEHRRERRSVRADRPERHHEGIARARSAAHAEHRPQPRLRPVVRARAAQLRRLDRHIKARALYAARDLTEADGRLVIRQACAAGRVAHEHRMHPRQPRSAHTMRTAQAPQSMPEMRRITSVIFAAAFRNLPTGQ